MGTDFMGAMRVCAHCRSNDDTVGWSDYLYFYVCDSCYTDIMDAKEDEKKNAE